MGAKQVAETQMCGAKEGANNRFVAQTSLHCPMSPPTHTSKPAASDPNSSPLLPFPHFNFPPLCAQTLCIAQYFSYGYETGMQAHPFALPPPTPLP